VLHFFPPFNDWLEELPDRRDPERIVYPTRFLAWWGLWLYLAQLGSRRQLDFQRDDWDSHVLPNLNRLAGTQQHSRPVHDPLDYCVGRVAELSRSSPRKGAAIAGRWRTRASIASRTVG
jgi:hypothetical protein